jgi:hypothetical protein
MRSLFMRTQRVTFHGGITSLDIYIPVAYRHVLKNQYLRYIVLGTWYLVPLYHAAPLESSSGYPRYPSYGGTRI